MKEITCSEIFYSIQGEGKRTGVPSVFIRTFGCTLRCRGFGGARTPDKVLPLDDLDEIKKLTSLHDVPIPDVGCDSYPSWDSRFLFLHKKYDVVSLADQVIRLSQENVSPDIVFTGGEPLLRGNQKFFVAFLKYIEDHTVIREITFETNGTVAITDEFASMLANSSFHVTFSISPKLANSGESEEDTIKPLVIQSYMNVRTLCSQVDMYLKFVVRSDEQILQVKRYCIVCVDAAWDVPVYLMPEGGTAASIALTEQDVVDLCLSQGYRFSARLHIALFGNAWET